MTEKRGKTQTARPRGHIEQRCEKKFLVRWRAEDANGVGRQVSEIRQRRLRRGARVSLRQTQSETGREGFTAGAHFRYVLEEWERRGAKLESLNDGHDGLHGEASHHPVFFRA